MTAETTTIKSSTLSRERAKIAFWKNQPRFIRRDRKSLIADIAKKPSYCRIDDAHSRHAIASWMEADTMYIWSTADTLYFPLSSESLFLSCMSLEEIEDGLFCFDKVNDAKYMFFGCGSLKSVSVSGMKSVTETDSMFANCTSLQEVRLSDCGFENLLSSMWMFRNCSSIKSVDFSELTADKILSIEGMFAECSSLQTVKMFASNDKEPEITTAKLLQAVSKNAWNNQALYDEFAEIVGAKTPGPAVIDWLRRKDRSRPKALKIIVEPHFSRALYDNSIISTSYAFAGCTQLSDLDMSRCQLIGVRQCRGMFDRCVLSEEKKHEILKMIPCKGD